MAADNGASAPQRPGFFKLLFPHPSNNLRIPKKFHTHFPSKLPKMATLLCPHAESWHVEICQTGQHIFFQRGWSEFSKAHDLHTGYLLLFQYTGVMNFAVEIFDTSCCHKDYPLKSCTRLVYHSNEVEVSYGSKDPSLSDESDSEINSSMRKVQKTGNVQINAQEQTATTHCKSPTIIDIEESSESETQKRNKEAHGIQINSFTERSNSRDSDDKQKEVFEKGPRDFQMEVQSKKNLMNTHNATNSAEFEKILTPAMLQNHKINIPRAFCVKNGLVANCIMFLKRKLEGKVVPNEWRVEFFSSPESVIRSGWKKFSMENSLKIGDRCIFRLVSGDTLLVETQGSSDSLGDQGRSVNGKVRRVPNVEKRLSSQQYTLRGNNCKRSKCIDIKDLTESDSRVSDAEIPGNFFSKRKNFSNLKEEDEEEEIQKNSLRKKILKIDPNSACFDQFEKILTHSAEKYSSINIPRAFCLKNHLVKNTTIFLKRKLEGKAITGKWPVKLFFGPSYCRLRQGWRKFSKENSLKAGNICIFQLISKDTFLVQKMVPVCLSTQAKKKLGPQGGNSPPIASMKETITCNRENQRDNTQCERVIKKYNLTAYMSLPKLFCEANGLVREQTIYLKRSINGKTWFVHFYPRKHEGRLCTGWRAFASENGLEEGDQCTFQLLSENTFEVNIVRKCQKEMLSKNCSRTGMKNVIGKSEISLTVRQCNLTNNYMTIPISFCRINKLTSSSLVLIMKAPERKVWCVNFYFSESKGCRFYGKGWKKLAFDNGLKAGDECLIKLVDKKTVLLQVVKS